MNLRKYKFLEVSWVILPHLFQWDGTKLVKFSGMPADAEISDATAEERYLVLKVHSESFPEVEYGYVGEKFSVTVEIAKFGPL